MTTKVLNNHDVNVALRCARWEWTDDNGQQKWHDADAADSRRRHTMKRRWRHAAPATLTDPMRRKKP